MKIRLDIGNLGLPFPDGDMNPKLRKDKKIILKGVLDKSLKGKEVILKGMTEDDVRDIRAMLLKEIKRQNDKNNI